MARKKLSQCNMKIEYLDTTQFSGRFTPLVCLQVKFDSFANTSLCFLRLMWVIDLICTVNTLCIKLTNDNALRKNRHLCYGFYCFSCISSVKGESSVSSVSSINSIISVSSVRSLWRCSTSICDGIFSWDHFHLTTREVEVKYVGCFLLHPPPPSSDKNSNHSSTCFFMSGLRQRLVG